MLSFRKTNEPIPRKRTDRGKDRRKDEQQDRRTDGRMDRQTLFYKTLLAEAGGPKKSLTVNLCTMKNI